MPNFGLAKWDFFNKLQLMQDHEGLKLANRITSRHINFSQQKLKVRLDVQLLSSSVAKSLEYLRYSNNSDCVGSLPTEVLITAVDRLFDILNSGCIASIGYKLPITASNAANIKEVLNDTRSLLLSLKDIRGTLLVKTRKGTCIIGLCCCIDSVIYLVDNILLTNVVNSVNLNIY